MSPNCLICGNNNSSIIYKEFMGYVEGTFFDIYQCHHCSSHFIKPESNLKELYEIIYSSEIIHGYDRYFYYLNSIKKEKEPLKFLAKNESTYYPVYKYLKDKKDINILEIGCGYGYLTYALKQKGFNVLGIDIASKAILKAKEIFGDYYKNIDLKSFADNSNKKFDLIIATEVIEHLPDPNGVIKLCKRVLKEEGKILLTTPDKDYWGNDVIWNTELPPVHISWIGKRGIEVLAEKHNMKPHFTSFLNYYSKNENKIVRYLRRRKEVGKSLLTKEGKSLAVSNSSFLNKIIKSFLHKMPFVRLPSNFLYNLILNKEATMGVILEKK